MLLNHFFNNFFNLFNINYNSLVGRLFGFLSLISNFVNLFNNNFIIVLSSNTDSNESYYGQRASARQIVIERTVSNAQAEGLKEALLRAERT